MVDTGSVLHDALLPNYENSSMKQKQRFTVFIKRSPLLKTRRTQWRWEELTRVVVLIERPLVAE